jgi:hypothetical protein
VHRESSSVIVQKMWNVYIKKVRVQKKKKNNSQSSNSIETNFNLTQKNLSKKSVIRCLFLSPSNQSYINRKGH